MKAIIVAAGRGTRLVPHTNCLPKCLLPFAGKRLLSWQRAALAANQIADVTVVRGFMGEQFDAMDVSLRDNPDWQTTNMVYSLLQARDVLASGESVIVSYGDIIYEPHIIESLSRSAEDIAVVVDTNWLNLWRRRFGDPLEDAESLRLSEDGRIIDIGRKVDTLDEIDAQYIGLMKFTPQGAAKLCAFFDSADQNAPWLKGRSRDTCYMTDLLHGMQESGTAINAIATTGGWLEFDTVNDLATYNDLLESGDLSHLFDVGWEDAQ